MMIKVFTTDKDGKIRLSTEELKALLDEAYLEGRKNNIAAWTYNTPNWSPYTITSTGSSATVTSNSVNAETITQGTYTCDSNNMLINGDDNACK